MNVVEVRTPLVARIVVGAIPDEPDKACMLPATADVVKIHLKMAMAGEVARRGLDAWSTRTSGVSWRKAANTCGRSAFIEDRCKNAGIVVNCIRNHRRRRPGRR